MYASPQLLEMFFWYSRFWLDKFLLCKVYTLSTQVPQSSHLQTKKTPPIQATAQGCKSHSSERSIFPKRYLKINQPFVGHPEKTWYPQQTLRKTCPGPSSLPSPKTEVTDARSKKQTGLFVWAMGVIAHGHRKKHIQKSWMKSHNLSHNLRSGCQVRNTQLYLFFFERLYHFYIFYILILNLTCKPSQSPAFLSHPHTSYKIISPGILPLSS